MNKFAKFSLILLGAFILFFAKVPSAQACSCRRSFGPEPLKILKAFRGADAVFVGRVIDTKLETDKDSYELTVDVFKPYKYAGGLTRIKIFTNDPNGTTCGYPARKDKEYLFYANETQQGDWSIYSCSRTGELANSTEDISFLDKWKSFNDSAFKVYQLIGVPTFLPILHENLPELWGPVAGTDPLTHSEGLFRNPNWFEGWKVYANLFIWVSILVIIVFFLRKVVISKIKKTKLKK